MAFLDSLNDILTGKKSVPPIPVSIDTNSIVRAAGVLLMAGVIFLLVQKLLTK